MDERKDHGDIRRPKELDTAIRLSSELRAAVRHATHHYDKIKLVNSDIDDPQFNSSLVDAYKRLQIALHNSYRAIDAALSHTATAEHQQPSASAAHPPVPRSSQMTSSQVRGNRVVVNWPVLDSLPYQDDDRRGELGMTSSRDMTSIVDRYTRRLSDRIFQLVSDKKTSGSREIALSPTDNGLRNSGDYNTKL